MSDFFSFRLPEDFVEKYTKVESPFGFKDAAENSLWRNYFYSYLL